MLLNGYIFIFIIKLIKNIKKSLQVFNYYFYKMLALLATDAENIEIFGINLYHIDLI